LSSPTKGQFKNQFETVHFAWQPDCQFCYLIFTSYGCRVKFSLPPVLRTGSSSVARGAAVFLDGAVAEL
jgi:hypothetical protein